MPTALTRSRARDPLPKPTDEALLEHYTRELQYRKQHRLRPGKLGGRAQNLLASYHHAEIRHVETNDPKHKRDLEIIEARFAAHGVPKEEVLKRLKKKRNR